MYKKLNFATGVLASGIANDAVEITLKEGHTITTDTGETNKFIGVFFDKAKSSPFHDVNREIVEAYRTNTNVFTIARAKEGTNAKAWVEDDNFMLIASSAVFDEYEDAINTKAPKASPEFTGTVILPKAVNVKDTSADHEYKLAVSELTADRTITLPLLTGNDEFIFKEHTQTLTNKRINPRIVSATSYTTDTGTSLNISTCDQFVITAQAGALKFNNPGGTPLNGQKLIIRIKDNGTARALTYDTQFRGIGVELPDTTVAGKTLYMGFIYNSNDTKWDLVASAQEE